MLKTHFNLRRLATAIIFTAGVLTLSHLPQETMPSALGEGGMDKPVHFLAYGIITFLFVISLKKSPTVLSVLFVFLAISVIGAVDELTQPFVGRTASIVDLAADILGIFTILLVSTVRRRRSLRLHP